MEVDENQGGFEKIALQRMVSYLLIGLSAAISHVAIRHLNWQSNASFHTAIETIVTSLSLLVGIMVMARFYAKRNNTFLFIGIGFLGTTLLDGYHTLVTAELFQPLMSPIHKALLPWIWAASRQILAVCLFLSWLAWYLEPRIAKTTLTRKHAIYFFLGATLSIILITFLIIHLRLTYIPDLNTYRPEAFLPTLFFLAALAGYLHKGKWKHNQFEHWLILSLILGIAGQLVFALQSGKSLDFAVDVAHVLKMASYLCILAGLLANTFMSFRHEEKRYKTLEIAREQTESILLELASQKMAIDEHALVAVTDTRGTITYANDKFCKVSKYQRQELIGNNHRILNSGYHPKSFFVEMYKTIENGKPWHGEIKNTAKDGSSYWVSTTIFPFKNTEGKITKYIAIRTDITNQKIVESVLQTNIDILNTTFDNFPGGISVFTNHLLLQAANPAFYRLLDLPEKQFPVGTSFEDIIRFNAERGEYGDGDIEKLVRTRVELAQNFEKLNFKRPGPDGTQLEIKGWPLPEGGFMSTYMDITEIEDTLSALEAKSREALINAEEARQAREMQIDAIHNIPEGFALWDGDDNLIMCNQMFNSIFSAIENLVSPGVSYETLVRAGYDANIYLTPSEDIEDHIKERIARHRTSKYEFEEELADGRWIRVSERPASDNRIVAIFEDISERKTAELAIKHMAQNDALTGLPNRNLFHERLQNALDHASRTGRKVGVMLLDLDHFKSINDTLGHPAGDALLCQVSDRLTECARTTDTVARLGGDEFAIIATNLKDALDIDNFARRIGEALARPYDLGGQEIHSGCSVGITIYPDDDGDSDELLRNADIALYKAKEAGRGGYKLFDSKMDAEISQRQSIEQELRQAIKLQQFQVYYQPQVELSSGKIIGAESLLRWKHPTRGLVSPGDFIQVAEATRLMLPIGEWIVNQVCRQAREWQDQGLPSIVIAVNQTPLQFQQQDLLQMIQTALAESQLDPQWLELEITEGVAMEGDSLAKIHALKKIGVRLAIDDFGSGSSSLALLKNCQVNRLKIDKSFVRSVNSTDGAKAICSAIVGLGKNLGLRVIAEGVETLHELDTVKEIGCDEIQGFRYAPPLPAKAFASLLRANDPKSFKKMERTLFLMEEEKHA